MPSDIRDFTWTASVDGESRRLKTRSTPSSSTKDVDTLSSPRVVRMQVAAMRYSVALPILPAAGLFEKYSAGWSMFELPFVVDNWRAWLPDLLHHDALTARELVP